ncbi:MAG: hypothetical protein ACREBE_23110, partial [bacterium]
MKRFGFDGARVGDIPLPGTISHGRWLTSAFVRAAVWQGDAAWAVREDGPVALPPAEIAAPITDGRWLTWRNGHASLWRSTSEVWRVALGEGTTLVDAAALLEGRLVALCLRERPAQGLRLLVLGVRDGAVFCSLRLTGVKRLRFAPRRGTALIHVADQVIAIDLRLGRVLREIAVGPEIEDFVVDETMQAVGLLAPDGMYALKYADFERGLVPEPPLHGPADLDPHDSRAAPGDRANALDHALAEGSLAEYPLPPIPDTGPSGAQVGEPGGNELPYAAVVAELAEVAPIDPPAPSRPPRDDASAPGPLWAFNPHEEWPLAGALEARRSLEARLDLLGARAWSAIAEAWDSGRISQPDSREPPFAAEVAGILHRGSGRAVEHLAAARAHVADLEAALAAIDLPRGKRLIPIEVLGRQFGRSPLAVSILLAVAGPHLRGDYARLYGVLVNDPARALCDELLVTHLLGVDRTD